MIAQEIQYTKCRNSHKNLLKNHGILIWIIANLKAQRILTQNHPTKMGPKFSPKKWFKKSQPWCYGPLHQRGHLLHMRRRPAVGEGDDQLGQERLAAQRCSSVSTVSVGQPCCKRSVKGHLKVAYVRWCFESHLGCWSLVSKKIMSYVDLQYWFLKMGLKVALWQVVHQLHFFKGQLMEFFTD